MQKLILPILLLTALGAQVALAQVSPSTGSQSGVVSGPSVPAPAVQPPGTFGGADTAVPAGVIPPQMPTTANPVGGPPPITAPEPSSAPRTQLSAPGNQPAPSP